MTVEFLLASVVVGSVVVYALSGGADFGGGAWSLFAYGKRKEAQRNLIEDAIAPIWETNHVWIILVIVVLFIAFPLAFSAIATSLHIPLTVMLIGIVLRGCAFIFRSYGMKEDEKLRSFWEKIFGVSSFLTPIVFGVVVAGIASGKLLVDVEKRKVLTDFVEVWFGIFPLCAGFFCLFTFMFLAAVYLTCETTDKELQQDFRNRALVSAIFVDATALFCLYLSQDHATLFWEGLRNSDYALLFHGFGILLAISIFYSLYLKKYKIARVLAMNKVVCIVLGWAVCQFPFLVVPNLTIYTATAPKNVLYMMFTIIVLGMVVTIPSLFYLYYIFKKKQS
ncbi:cytochrome d ubiquinol oxidase subunit II [Candidatus Uabimicrobium sp. HlEnr_7]|uniref:cytochrome d ubiquinol oxidase subunit II n=1 Tax=Candidatus Uabimicrobium helgolandensis TaxID=3095367 RepID=UPI003557D50D